MSVNASSTTAPYPDEWCWPVDLSRYDRGPELTSDEKKALALVERGISGRTWYFINEALPNLERLLTPFHEALAFSPTANGNHKDWRARNALLREMNRRQTSYWAWEHEDWLWIMQGSRSEEETDEDYPYYLAHPGARSPLAVVAYILCDQDAYRALATFRIRKFAERMFGVERLEAACRVVHEELAGWGVGVEEAKQKLPSFMSRILLANRSPHLEDLTVETLEFVVEDYPSPSHGRNLVAFSRALAARGYIERPLEPAAKKTYPRKTRGAVFEDDCPEDWAGWCRRWYETSTLAPNTRTGHYGYVVRAGRWLARNHPEITSPEDWTRELAAEYVAAVDRLTIGEWADASRTKPERIGKPLKAGTKASHLAATAAFFRDLQEWGWIRRRFDPHRTFALPQSIKGALGADPRPISDESWAKLLWAGLNLEEEDLPRAYYGPGGAGRKSRPHYPLEMAKALAVVWLFAGLRGDEIRRLRVGCVRWQRGEVAVQGTNEMLPEEAVCWLDVPVNKTGSDFTKPVDPIVGKVIAAWETVRPEGQPAALDEKTAEEVSYLFSYRGQRMSRNYLNNSLIPTLCRKAGVPEEDTRGRITCHRGRSTIATHLFNAREPMSLFELQEWLNHRTVRSTQYYAKIAPTRLAKAYNDAGYFGRNLRMIEVLVDQEAVRNGLAALGEPWKYYDLGHGFCTYDYFKECPHRMACAKCSFYVPKGSAKEQLLEAKANLSRMREEIPLTDEELEAVGEGIELQQKLLERLADVPTPAGPTPRELRDKEAALETSGEVDPSRRTIVPLHKKEKGSSSGPTTSANEDESILDEESGRNEGKKR